ncbi:hypothetical protein O1M63_04010 [Streptomyces mirabilis]|nr:hypothetical protein [Streptomyces mirabilis]
MSRTDRPRAAKARHPGHALAADAALLARLESAAPGAVTGRASDRLSFAHDACTTCSCHRPSSPS